MHATSWVPASADAAGSQDYTAFYRALLTRQRDVRRGVWWWLQTAAQGAGCGGFRLQPEGTRRGDQSSA